MATTIIQPHKLPNETVYDGMVLWKAAAESIPRIHNLRSTSEDVFLATYPRSGTTWTGELLSMIDCNGDLESMRAKLAIERCPFLEFNFFIPNLNRAYEGVEEAKQREGTPRIMKTHLPYKYIQKQIEENGSKLVVVIRNVRDVLVSYYHFYKSNPQLGSFQGTWDEFFEMFINKRLAWGDWLDHVRSYYAVRSRENVQLIYYEDAVDDLQTTVQELVKFMGKSLPRETIDKIIENGQFGAMQGRADKIVSAVAKSNFFRKGTYGGWREYFTPAQDEYITVNYDKELERMGLRLKS